VLDLALSQNPKAINLQLRALSLATCVCLTVWLLSRKLLCWAREPSLSYPRQHATAVVFIEFANALLPIRLSLLLCASLRARRVSSVVPQHSCLPLARVNAHVPARCHCDALALRPSGFTHARVCR
jgi:hypothetical protein